MSQTAPTQSQLWNGPAGEAWVKSQDLLDGLFRPFEELLTESAGGRVLDIGCGTGSTTLAVARRLKGDAHCLGVDLSEPMIAAARKRALQEGINASFLCADAQRAAFEPASFDLLLSRFGVMFFDDPVAAFKNLAGAAKPGAELRFIAWRDPAENAFMLTAERAAASLVSLPERKANAPGQFGFANQSYIREILQASGWTQLSITRIEVACALPEAQLDTYITHLGPLGLALREADEATLRRVIETVRPAFARYIHAEQVRFNAACWLVVARRG